MQWLGFRGAAFTALLLTILFLFVAPCQAKAPSANNQKVIMVIANRVSVEDLLQSNLPNIKQLITKGSLGLMTVNTGGGFTDVNAYATIGFGKPAIGTNNSGSSFNLEEKVSEEATALEVYRRTTDLRVGENKIVLTSLPQLIKSNEKIHSYPGILAENLNRKGKMTAVIGNSDGDGKPNRLAALIGIDAKGKVHAGNVSKNILKPAPDSPYGFSTNYKLLQEELDKVILKADLVIVETGDTFRVNMAYKELTKQMQIIHREKALERLDTFAGHLLQLVSQDNLVMLVSPLPSSESFLDGKRLSPVIMAGGKINSGGVLTSPSTPHTGLIANYDLTATVLAHMGIALPEKIIGLPVRSIQNNNSTNFIWDKYQQLNTTFNQRPFLLNWYIYFQVILLILLALALLIKWENFYKKLRPFLIALLIFPLAFLILPLFGPRPLYLELLLIIMVVLILTVILLIFNKKPIHMLVLSVSGTIVVIISDIVAGSRLMNRSILGHDPIRGGHFYGIGNEYMGTLIGASILLVTLIIYLRPMYEKKLLLQGAGFFFCTLIFFLSNEFYISQAYQHLSEGNFILITNFIHEKLLSNWHLIHVSTWTKVLILLLINAFILFRGYHREFKHHNRIYLRQGFTGITTAGIASLFLNDLGVIAFTTMLVFIVIPTAIILMDSLGETKNFK